MHQNNNLSINNSEMGKAYMTAEDPTPQKRDANTQRYEDILVPLGSILV
jgi:hypothetical protein